MKIMVFDVGGTEIKYSVMDEQMHRTDSGAVPTPQDTQAQFLDTVYRLYAPHKDEVTGIAMALPGFVDNRTGYVSNGGALLYNTATPVGQLLAEKCGCPVILENDGKALPEDAPLDGRSFFAAANAGEPEALEVLRRFCHAVAVQIYNLTVLLDVEKVAIGGGISKQPLLLESLRSAYNGLYASRAGQAYMEGLPRCQIVPCAFSSEANQVGVAAAYFEAMQKKR